MPCGDAACGHHSRLHTFGRCWHGASDGRVVCPCTGWKPLKEITP